MKGPLLPRWLREKGKSKFLFPRLQQEKIPLNGLWNGEIKESPIDKLYKKYEHLAPKN